MGGGTDYLKHVRAMADGRALRRRGKFPELRRRLGSDKPESVPQWCHSLAALIAAKRLP